MFAAGCFIQGTTCRTCKVILIDQQTALLKRLVQSLRQGRRELARATWRKACLGALTPDPFAVSEPYATPWSINTPPRLLTSSRQNYVAAYTQPWKRSIKQCIACKQDNWKQTNKQELCVLYDWQIVQLCCQSQLFLRDGPPLPKFPNPNCSAEFENDVCLPITDPSSHISKLGVEWVQTCTR